MSLITIIDYGVGNLRSIEKAIEKLGETPLLTHDPEKVSEASKVILPGVGAFDEAIKNLKKRGLDEAIHKIIAKKIPFLGICLGMQLLFKKSEEGELAGLGILKGENKKFIPKDGFKVPQMGWNTLEIKDQNSKLLKGIPKNTFMYFVHSFYVTTPQKEAIASTTNYSLDFVSTVETENIFLTQYHPEKSGQMGLQILNNFLKIEGG